MNLTIWYFMVAILHQVGVTYDLLKPKEQSSSASGEKPDNESTHTRMWHHALQALDFAPQICVLFLGARMRALQLGHSDPQQWARIFFFAAAYAVQLYSLLVACQEVVGQNKALSLIEVLSL